MSLAPGVSAPDQGGQQYQDRAHAHQAGFNAHLVKPADPAVLAGLIVAHQRKGESTNADEAGARSIKGGP